jgi:hypothetical protein
MNKKKIFFLSIFLVIALFIGTFAVIAKTALAELEINNKTSEPVAISLTNGSVFYYLTVPPETTKVFTVERLVYDRTTWACGLSDSGSVDITKFMWLTFTACGGPAPNWGEPRLEKVHIPDAPNGINWLYK